MDRNVQVQLWFTEYSQGIYHFLSYYTGRSDVEDLVQEVFMRAIKNYERFERKSSAKTWLYSIARNVAIDHLRKKKLLKWLPETRLSDRKSNDRTPEEILDASEESRELYSKINQLKQNYREVLILRGIKDLSVSETAEILNCSESKVSLTLHRAINALRKMY